MELFQFYSIGDFINKPQSKTEFEILQFDSMEEPDVDDVHRHTFYEILWVDSGKSRQIIDYVPHNLGSRSLFFISPGQVHEFEAWQPLQGGTIMFTRDFFLMGRQDNHSLFELSFLDNAYTNPQLQLGTGEFTAVRSTITQLLHEKGRKNPDEQILQSLLHILLRQIQRGVDSKSTHKKLKRHLILQKQFQELIDRNFKTNNTAQYYADELNITQHHLNRIIKEQTGKTATELIRARTLLEAKRMLTFTDMTISEIAAELGFFDSSYFAKIFKKEEGVSASAFHQRMSEKYRTR
jgi:AraC family transcriptional regulator, transcriptional activator of pobA